MTLPGHEPPEPPQRPTAFRTYFDVTGDDRSALGAQVAAQRARVRDRLATVLTVIAVASGKGGVGKSFITAGLALALARRGRRVAVLDADLKSPMIPSMLEAAGPLRVDGDGVHPAVGRQGVLVMSSGLLLDDGTPLAWGGPVADRFLWRGALEVGATREFLSDTVWGERDILIVDLPPDMDRLTDMAELVPQLAGTIVITIPSDESRRSVARTIRAAGASGIHLLGIVENMSGYRCGACGSLRPLFPGAAGADLALELGVPLLARVPFAENASAQEEPALEPVVDCLEDRIP